MRKTTATLPQKTTATHHRVKEKAVLISKPRLNENLFSLPSTPSPINELFQAFRKDVERALFNRSGFCLSFTSETSRFSSGHQKSGMTTGTFSQPHTMTATELAPKANVE